MVITEDYAQEVPFPILPWSVGTSPQPDCHGGVQLCHGNHHHPLIFNIMIMTIFIHQVDSCPPYFSEEELTEMFMQNFQRHYDTNRAPLGLYFHTLWFKQAKNRKVII